jgi:hypothetical protein
MNTKWTKAENVALVAAYLLMLEKHNKGEKFNKAQIRRELIGTDQAKGPLFCRSNASIEFKLMNVSGCMKALGRHMLPGYQAAMNYQADLMATVCEALNIKKENGSAAA